MNLTQLLPIAGWLPAYRRADLPGDATAGVVTAIMLVPQSMAYALLAGLPPQVGLYASVVPLLLYAVFGSSRALAVGPVALVSLLVASSAGVVAEQTGLTLHQVAITLAFMVGVISVLLGLLRAGFLVNFLSHPVISGFTSAAALVIGFSQLKHAWRRHSTFAQHRRDGVERGPRQGRHQPRHHRGWYCRHWLSMS